MPCGQLHTLTYMLAISREKVKYALSTGPPERDAELDRGGRSGIAESRNHGLRDSGIDCAEQIAPAFDLLTLG